MPTTSETPFAARPTVVVPFYNGHAFLERLLDSVEASDCAVIVVDNSPSDAPLVDVDRENVTILRTAPAIGFGRANNVGALYAIANGTIGCIFTNQDGFFRGEAVQKLVEASHAHGDALVSALPDIYETGRITSNTYRFFLGQIQDYVSDLLTGVQPKNFYAAFHPAGSCFYVPVSRVRQLGLFEPMIYMYAEDTDLFERYHAASVPTGINPLARFAHRHSNISAEGETKRRIQAWSFESRNMVQLRDSQTSPLLTLLTLAVKSTAGWARYRVTKSAPHSPDLATRTAALKGAYSRAVEARKSPLKQRMLDQALQDCPALEPYRLTLVQSLGL